MANESTQPASCRFCIFNRHVLTVLLVGLAATFGLASYERQTHRNHEVKSLRGHAENAKNLIQSLVEARFEEFTLVKAFYAASNFVDEQEFRRFVTPLLSEDGMTAVMWLPQVTDEQRHDFESPFEYLGQTQRVKIKPYDEYDEHGQDVTAMAPQIHYPIRYSEPYEKFGNLRGLDYATCDTFGDLLQKSRDTGISQVSQATPFNKKFMADTPIVTHVFVPVYINGKPTDTLNERRENFHGCILFVIRPDQTIEHAMDHLTPVGVDLFAYDDNNAENNLIHQHLSRTRSPDQMANVHIEKQYSRDEFVVVGDREWRIVFNPAPVIMARIHADPWGIVVLIGSIGSILLATLVSTMLNRQQHVTYMVEEQTGQLERAKKEAQSANQSKSDFLANMSHEIRTPMGAILGYADLLGENNLSPDDHANHVDIIKRNGQHLLEILNDILDLSKIEAGKFKVEYTDVALAQIINDVISLLRVRAIGKGIKLDSQYVLPIPAVIQTDPVRLRQILMNLIGNAIKFTEQGSVNVRVRYDNHDPKNQRAIIEVIDTGIGISEEQIDRLFTPFQQADYSMTRQFGGTGLGLTISKRLAQMLGGDINVKSQLGEGSSFTVNLEAHADPNVKMIGEMTEVFDPIDPDKKQATTATALCGKILLAEDGPDNQRLISFLLRKAGLHVDVAGNGKIAMNMAFDALRHDEPYDLILMDMQMPEMDGYTATGKLRKANYDRPIIALTAHAMAGDKEKCLDAGCDDYTTKPVKKQELLDLINSSIQYYKIKNSA